MNLKFKTLRPGPKAKPMPSKHDLSLMSIEDRMRHCRTGVQTALSHFRGERICCVCPKDEHFPEQYIVAHHEDYLRPLRVVFLCGKHHKLRHRQMKNKTNWPGGLIAIESHIVNEQAKPKRR